MMSQKNPDFPHRRLNALTNDWVLVSPQRTKRPWQGHVEKGAIDALPVYNPQCYLCPGNERAGGVRNPKYESTFVFDNDFAALNLESGQLDEPVSHFFTAKPEIGICKVVCFSPWHNLTIPELQLPQVVKVIESWSEETRKLYSNSKIIYVQVFENKGEIMGCSNPHPHSQIWSQSMVPNEPARELITQRNYFSEYGRPLLLDYLAAEHQKQDRIILANDHFTALVPWWAVWPFEILVIAHRQVADLPSLTVEEVSALADIYRQVTIRYDNLFETSFPYSMGFHQAPNDGEDHPEWVLHAHFYPPLLRSATVKKFMVGYELLAMPQRDLTPESAAERLRSLPDVHYKSTAR